MIRRIKTLLNRELDNGHLSFGEHESQRYPCTVVETPRGIDIAGKACIPEKINYLPGEIGTSRCRIFDAVQFRGKPVKIVDRLVGFCGVNTGPQRIPVRRNA
jgi:hypothetical protein